MVQIAIIGGGIGGLTAALTFQQSGFRSEVFEQAPARHDVGAAIAIWPNAMRILQQLSLADAILEKAGGRFAILPVGGFFQPGHGLRLGGLAGRDLSTYAIEGCFAIRGSRFVRPSSSKRSRSATPWL